jgi:hypothetical protein
LPDYIIFNATDFRCSVPADVSYVSQTVTWISSLAYSRFISKYPFSDKIRSTSSISAWPIVM